VANHRERPASRNTALRISCPTPTMHTVADAHSGRAQRDWRLNR